MAKRIYTPEDFVKEFIQEAERVSEETKIPVMVILAQSALESGYGNYAPGYNFFGYKASSSWEGDKQLLWTTEFANGQRVRIQTWFRAYANAYESFTDYGKLIQRRFPKAFEYTDAVDFIKSIQNDHPYKYATDPEYIDKIISVMGVLKKYYNPDEKKKFAQIDKEEMKLQAKKRPGIKDNLQQTIN